MNKFSVLFYFYFCFLFKLFSNTKAAQAITFTQSQTAAEKQMVGEDKELEKMVG